MLNSIRTMLAGVLVLCVANSLDADLSVIPSSIRLVGNTGRATLLAEDSIAGMIVDQTRNVTFESEAPAIATVSQEGVIRAVSDGKTTILVKHAGEVKRVPVEVVGSRLPREFHFENDIIPILSRFGCNTSGCHGKAEGQNGFKLSIFGFAPEADHAALTQESRGRRTISTIPEKSLLLLKASGGMPHGGGVRIRRNSGDYRVIRDWIAAGSPFGDNDVEKVVELKLYPVERRMRMNATQQLQVKAVYSDGHEVDVTHHAKFQSNNESIANVDEFGRVRTGDVPGESAIMASYMGAVAVFRSVIPQPASPVPFPKRPVFNFVDRHVDAKLMQLNVHSSELCSDADFLRRVYLDVIGTLPTVSEAREFLASKDKEKRKKLVASLLVRPEYADYWSLKWADLLRVDRLKLGHKQAYKYYHWIHDSFKSNKPMDQFAREIVTAKGLVSRNPGANLYKVVTKPGDLASTVSQVFLGVRIECAQCHHHPFDRWSQEDYAGMKAFFTQVNFKTVKNDQMLITSKKTRTTHPRTGKVVEAHALLQAVPERPSEGDRRTVLADWMTSRDNPWFAKNIVNRTWAHFLGRGIVEPVDDVRLTNPPSNPKLLDALAQSFIDSEFNMHSLIQTITASRTYQLSAAPNAMNTRDEQNYSRALLKKLDAEVRFDMICQVTDVPEKFDGMPSGYRAIQLWDSQVKHYFLRLFGRPVRATACECERATEPSVSQVLHMLNSPGIQAKLSDDRGRLANLAAKYSTDDDDDLVTELFLLLYSRYPTLDEQQTVIRFLASQDDRRRAVEDIAWSLMNTIEFAFNH